MRGASVIVIPFFLVAALLFPVVAFAADEGDEGGGSPAPAEVKDYSGDLEEIKALLTAFAPTDADAEVLDYSESIEDLKTLLSGLVSVNLFILLACLLSLGVSLASVFVGSIRRVD